MEVQADDTAEAIDNMADAMLALVDPAFAAFRAGEDFRDAHNEAAEAAVNFGVGSKEHVLALFNLTEAGLKLSAANETLDGNLSDVEEGLRFLTAEGLLADFELRLILETLGLFTGEPLWTPEQITNAILMKDALEATNAALTGPVSSGRFDVPRGEPIVAPRNISRLHQGGIIPGPVGADVPIIAQAGEQVIPAAQVSGGGGGGGVTINIDGDVTEAVLEDIQRELILESVGRLVETR